MEYRFFLIHINMKYSYMSYILNTNHLEPTDNFQGYPLTKNSLKTIYCIIIPHKGNFN